MEGFRPEASSTEVMETVPYNREAVAEAAHAKARELLAARGIENVAVQEQEVHELMLELAEENGNRHVVEALACLRLKAAKERGLWEVTRQFGVA